LQALEKAAKKGQDPTVTAWIAAQDATIAVESVTLAQLQPWRSALSQGAISPIAAELEQMSHVDGVDRTAQTPETPEMSETPDPSSDAESSRFGQSFRQLWTVLQTDVLAGVGASRSPTTAGWQAIAVYLVALETIARCRFMLHLKQD
jgi:hypothetical protein